MAALLGRAPGKKDSAFFCFDGFAQIKKTPIFEFEVLTHPDSRFHNNKYFT
jgi:hypothetical protein